MKINSIKLWMALLFILILSNIVLSLDKSRVEIGADLVNEFGITGRGNTICLIDDGVDYTNEYLGSCTTPQYQAGNCPTVVAGRNIRDGDSDILPNSNQDHGTHIAGILISSHPYYRGIAPDARLAVVKAYSDIDNSWSCQGFIDAINWCVNNSEQYNITAISLSQGLNPCVSFSSEFRASINNATSHGVSFIKSSGNTPSTSDLGMTFPAELGNVTATGSTSGQSISRFTRRTPTSSLDILAPGHKIRSTRNGGGLSPFLHEIICLSDHTIFTYDLQVCDSGTSYAAPHIAAAVALLKEFDPALTPYDIEHILEESGDDISDSITGATFKKINLLKALGVFDWPTENHDFRRTGFTILKGDMDERSDISRTDFVMEPAAISGQEQVVKAIVADADGNGKMETVSFVHRNTISNQTRIYAVEISKDKRRYESGYTQTATKKWGTSPITMLGVGGAGGATSPNLEKGDVL